MAWKRKTFNPHIDYNNSKALNVDWIKCMRKLFERISDIYAEIIRMKTNDIKLITARIVPGNVPAFEVHLSHSPNDAFWRRMINFIIRALMDGAWRCFIHFISYCEMCFNSQCSFLSPRWMKWEKRKSFYLYCTMLFSEFSCASLVRVFRQQKYNFNIKGWLDGF